MLPVHLFFARVPASRFGEAPSRRDQANQHSKKMAEQVAAADDAALLEKLLWTSKDEADCETWRSAKIKAWEAGEKIKEKYPERAQLASTRVEIGAPSSRRIYGDNSGAP